MFDADLPVSLVVSDRPCAALEIGRQHGVSVELIGRTGFGGFTAEFDRDGYTTALAKTLLAHDVDLVAMAGFGTVLSAPVHDAFPGRIMNTHPSLLPDFPG